MDQESVKLEICSDAFRVTDCTILECRDLEEHLHCMLKNVVVEAYNVFQNFVVNGMEESCKRISLNDKCL